MKKAFLEKECDVSRLKGKKVCVVGYGIQGRAQALNLRDSSVDVVISNRDDAYLEQAIKDGFDTIPFNIVTKVSDIVMLLIPDGAHKEFIKKYYTSGYKKGSLIIFAHGYSLRFEDLGIPSDVDIAMVAPRYPGQQIRDSYIERGGVPAFVDIVDNKSGECQDLTLAICDGIGFSKGGVLNVSYKEEAEIDLFIEQFMAPLFYSAVENSIKMLTEKGYSNMVACLELYFSGELGAVRTMMSQKGMYYAFRKNASPTCQYGVASRIDDIFGEELRGQMEYSLDRIVSGKFARDLQAEQSLGYPTLKDFYKNREDNIIDRSEKEVAKYINKEVQYAKQK